MSGFTPWRKIAREKQLAPEGEWSVWLILAGRGFGKSRSVNEWAIEQARKMPGSRGALVAATSADVRDVVMEGESGILNISPPDFQPRYYPSKRRVEWPNGSIATTYSADEPDRLRGPQHHWAMCDELAAWRYEDAWDQLMLGLRLGDDPRVAVATTPRPTRQIRQLIDDPNVHVVTGSTYENRDNLARTFFEKIITKYEGTRLGRQELMAELLTDVEGALWSHGLIEAGRVKHAPDLIRVVVAIDPAVSVSESSDETGIIVAGIDRDGDAYVLEDVTGKYVPHEWAETAIAAYHRWKADRIVAEKNQGGDMVESTLRVVDRRVPVTLVTASRAKVTRAEPVAALYEQGRAHHVGVLARLEDQMTTWQAGDKDSPDRVDALVWGLTELVLNRQTITIQAAPAALANYRG